LRRLFGFSKHDLDEGGRLQRLNMSRLADAERSQLDNMA
jgi:hypothetical protein